MPQSDSANSAPSVPDPRCSSLIVWTGYHSSVDVRRLDRRVVGGIAKPLVHAGADSLAISRALDLGLGVALPGEAWRNQLPLDHPKRAGAFSMLPFAYDKRVKPYVRWSRSFVDDYAANHVDAQLAAGGTLVTTAAHVHQAEHGRSRHNDLRLAEAAVTEFRSRGAERPAREGLPSRAIFASIAVQGPHIQDAADRLADAYASIPADGYWIVVVNGSSLARELAGTAALAFELQERTQKPAVVSCVGRPHAALLSEGLAATCTGHQRGSFTFPPTVWDRPSPEGQGDDEENDDFGIGTHVYHLQIRGAVQLGTDGEKLSKRLFSRWPCPCGTHQAKVPPATSAQKKAHNQWCLEHEAFELCSRALPARRPLLESWLDKATAARKELKMSRLPAGWRAVSREIDRRRDSDDAAGGRKA